MTRHHLKLLGELSYESVRVLEAELERLCRAETRVLTLDLSRLESIDWTGVRVIAFRAEWCRRHGCELLLVPGPEHVQRMFDSEDLGTRLRFIADPSGDLARANQEQASAPAAAHCASSGGLGRREKRSWKRARSRG
ncbi:MAG TPA: STAS domain-containing protein [Solirubrobacteraceae bacterium]|jgi:anti-anti-sigma factor|nr:STAS domain-containing protein [Solirubrobacteraceae bacterium]